MYESSHQSTTRTPENEQLLRLGALIGEGLQRGQKIPPQNLQALVKEFLVKQPARPPVDRIEDRELKLLAASKPSVHH